MSIKTMLTQWARVAAKSSTVSSMGSMIQTYSTRIAEVRCLVRPLSGTERELRGKHGLRGGFVIYLPYTSDTDDVVVTDQIHVDGKCYEIVGYIDNAGQQNRLLQCICERVNA